jgi:hypothetical protein
MTGSQSFAIIRHRISSSGGRKCLQNADVVTRYTTLNSSASHSFRGKKPFAALSIVGREVAAVCTGIHDRRTIKCGISVRPAGGDFALRGYRGCRGGIGRALRDEGRCCDLVDVFAWSTLQDLTRWGFRKRQEEGSVVVDLSLGPDTLFRNFSANRRTNIKKAIKAGAPESRADAAWTPRNTPYRRANGQLFSSSRIRSPMK